MQPKRLHCKMLSLLVCSLAVARLGVTSVVAPADSPEALAKRIQDQVIPASLEKLDVLVAGPDATIALAAAWERVRRMTPATTQPFTGANMASPDRFNASPGPEKSVLARFLGVVEGRLRCTIPKAWAASVGSAKYTTQRIIWFPTNENYYPMKGMVLGLIGGRLIPHRVGDRWIVKAGGEPSALAADHLMGRFDFATVKVQGDMAYVALYTNSPNPYTLCAVKRSSGTVIWSTEVRTGYSAGGVGGAGEYHVIELQFAGDKVAVFGLAGPVRYVEVLDARTGKKECEFSTSYFPRG